MSCRGATGRVIYPDCVHWSNSISVRRNSRCVCPPHNRQAETSMAPNGSHLTPVVAHTWRSLLRVTLCRVLDGLTGIFDMFSNRLSCVVDTLAGFLHRAFLLLAAG
jgi:hypothetical protein